MVDLNVLLFTQVQTLKPKPWGGWSAAFEHGYSVSTALRRGRWEVNFIWGPTWVSLHCTRTSQVSKAFPHLTLLLKCLETAHNHSKSVGCLIMQQSVLTVRILWPWYAWTFWTADSNAHSRPIWVKNCTWQTLLCSLSAITKLCPCCWTDCFIGEDIKQSF